MLLFGIMAKKKKKKKNLFQCKKFLVKKKKQKNKKQKQTKTNTCTHTHTPPHTPHTPTHTHTPTHKKKIKEKRKKLGKEENTKKVWFNIALFSKCKSAMSLLVQSESVSALYSRAYTIIYSDQSKQTFISLFVCLFVLLYFSSIPRLSFNKSNFQITNGIK